MTYRFQLASTPQEFRDIAQSALSHNATVNRPLLFNMELFPSLSEWKPGQAGALIFGNDLLAGVVFQGSPGRAIISDMPVEAAQFGVHEWLKHSGPLVSLFGPETVVENLINDFKHRLSSWVPAIMRTMAYELQEVTHPSSLPAGHMRFAEEAEDDLLVEFGVQFMIDCKLAEDLPSMRDDLTKGVQRALRERRLAVWDVDGKIVAKAAMSPKSSIGQCIGSVYTPSEFRGRGYASALVAQLSQHILDAGSPRCFLDTDAENPTSNAIYQRIGYRHLCNHLLLKNPPELNSQGL